MKFHLDDAAGFGERAIGRLAISEDRVHEHVVGDFVPYRRRAFSSCECILRVRDPGQLLVFDLEAFSRVGRLFSRFCHHHRERFAHVAHFVRR